jgi:signal transduction histidine kinase
VVSLGVVDSMLVARVTDDGAGFASPFVTELPGPAGHGLATMRERAEELGGTLDIRCGEHGTVVTATLPVVGA